jgi:hypothetical protein
MAPTRKGWVTRSLLIVLALLLLAGAYEIWSLSGARTRPWHLEVYLGSRLAECRTGPGAFRFSRDYGRIEAKVKALQWSLLEVNRKWRLQRDYSSCIGDILSLCLEAHLLKLQVAQRHQEQRSKAQAFLSSLRDELGKENGNGKIWSRFELRSLEEGRARSLASQATYLNHRGEYESALTATLRAWVSWQRFNHSSSIEFARFEDPGQRQKWDQQAAALQQWTKRSGRRAILVGKLEHVCVLLKGGGIEKSYVANLGRNWYRRKVQERDASTPEGDYKIRRMIPSGRYGAALLLDYPNATDREQFLALKRQRIIPARARIGGSIEIHGGGRADSDWTDGCVSLDDADMRDLYRLAYPGMPVAIVGTSRLTSTAEDGAGVAR